MCMDVGPSAGAWVALQRSNSLSPCTHQPPIATRWDMEPLLHQCWDLVGLIICKTGAHSPNCGFMCATVLLCPANTVFSTDIHSLGLWESSCLLFCSDLWAFGEGCDIDIPLRADHSTVSCSLHVGQPLGSLFTAIYGKRKPLCWGLEDAQVLGLQFLWCHCKIRNSHFLEWSQ